MRRWSGVKQGMANTPSKPYRVTLHQFGESPKHVTASSTDEASRLVTAFQDFHGLGASDVSGQHGRLVHRGKTIGRISYNGKVVLNAEREAEIVKAIFEVKP